MSDQVNHEAYLTALKEGGVSPTTCEEILRLSEPCVGLRAVSADDPHIPLGASKFGGAPDLPPGSTWPKWQGNSEGVVQTEGGPLQFLCQINLSDVAACYPDSPLPSKGLLSFFYDVSSQPWGFEGDGEAWRVLYTPEDQFDRLKRINAPMAQAGKSGLFEVFAALSLPWGGFDVGDEEVGDEDWDAYWDFSRNGTYAALRGQASTNALNQMFGIPHGEQSEVWRAWASLNGEDPDESDGKRWVMLLQLDSDDAAGWCWGDLGRIHFGITKSDLAARDFSNVQFTLECG